MVQQPNTQVSELPSTAPRNTDWNITPMLLEVVDYLYDRVDNCERHCRWTHGANYVRVKFRYERDALLFALRF